jgi:hypothetical protein
MSILSLGMPRACSAGRDASVSTVVSKWQLGPGLSRRLFRSIQSLLIASPQKLRSVRTWWPLRTLLVGMPGRTTFETFETFQARADWLEASDSLPTSFRVVIGDLVPPREGIDRPSLTLHVMSNVRSKNRTAVAESAVVPVPILRSVH